MGRDVGLGRYGPADFHAFAERLRQETALLRDWLQQGHLLAEPPRIGFELEAWLVDSGGQPMPRNQDFLQRMDDPLVVPELARFNVELNGPPRWLEDNPFHGLADDLGGLWQRCNRVGESMGLYPVMVGILPSVRPDHLGLPQMTDAARYRALNEQVLALRNQQPFRVAIRGPQGALELEQQTVMLEAAATSLQLHLQLTPDNAARCFNAAQIMSAASVAVAANAPTLFGRRLWHDTRIPLFEQAVAVDSPSGVQDRGLDRVTFGTGYTRDSLYPLFVENRQHYPVLLPEATGEPPEQLSHLSLHNGTIWRWNRPLVGVDASGRCHLRLEHRVMSAGPSVPDVVANACFFQGLIQACCQRPEPLEAELPFRLAERNFYRAARDGLDARVDWIGGQRGPLRELILEQLLPMAADGLRRFGLEEAAWRPWLELMRERVTQGRTGAVWQQLWLDRHGGAMEELVCAYRAGQQSGQPVHDWEI